MKPEWITDVVIELARKLKEAGYRKEITVGDWVAHPENIAIWLVKYGTDKIWASKYIPIPDLSTCLRWLKGKTDFRVELWGHQRRETWICRWEGGLGDVTKWKEAPIPEEAAYLAMIKILKGEEK